MARWTQADYRAHMARAFVPAYDFAKDASDGEAVLHDQIAEECRRRGWLAFHGRMDRKTGRTAGEPDFVILAHEGQKFLVECKTKTGKLSVEQQALHAHARHLGHEVYTVRSLEDFLKLL